MFQPPFQLLADAVLILHAAIVAFVVGGLFVILVGNFRNWRWVNGLLFRAAHLSAIAVVVGQAWLGAACPLTILEMHLREKAQATTYTGSFIEHWLQRALYYDLPTGVFLVAYSVFSLIVFACWWLFPPMRTYRSRQPSAKT